VAVGGGGRVTVADSVAAAVGVSVKTRVSETGFVTLTTPAVSVDAGEGVLEGVGLLVMVSVAVGLGLAVKEGVVVGSGVNVAVGVGVKAANTW
jgi:hypothetical protein